MEAFFLREKILWNEDWLFCAEPLPARAFSVKGPLYKQAKSERARSGPAARMHNDAVDDYRDGVEYSAERWSKVCLPHDFVIEGVPEERGNNARGFFAYRDGWYRKHFTLPPSDAGRRLALYFEGVATWATVYLNGCLLKRNFCGYTPFEVDITDLAEFGTDNVLAVHVETGESEGWWYDGGGLYRNVYLVKTDRVAVDLYGVYVAPRKIGEELWRVPIEITLRNDAYAACEAEARVALVEETGAVAASARVAGALPARAKTALLCETQVCAPRLWDVDAPHLYKAVVCVYVAGELRDQYETRFGFRTVCADPQNGLFLNGKPVKIQGVCAHADFGLSGKAVPDNILRWKIRRIREMGANGYRASHYPHAEATMDALDEMGFLVMDETRWFESSEDGLEQLRTLVRRDRNRPSVLFWSTSNEEDLHVSAIGRNIHRAMAAEIRKLDDTRLITAAISVRPDRATIGGDLDAIGVNYNLPLWDPIHEKWPRTPVFISECCATGTTRGWYGPDSAEHAYLSAYDRDTNESFLGREKTWKAVMARPWLLGAYQWIAFEHRGEAAWPRLCSQSGAIDLFMQNKDAFYQNQSHWTGAPMVHLLPHWNHAGREGEPIAVWAYTNCEEVELWLNGRSQGRRRIERFGHGEWQVAYEPGELNAVGYVGGVERARDAVHTSGPAVGLKLVAEDTRAAANGQDIAVFTCLAIDAEGREVPDASATVTFFSSPLGRIVGAGSDVSEHKRLSDPAVHMRAGRAAVAVRLGAQHGTLRVMAQADGWQSAHCELEI